MYVTDGPQGEGLAKECKPDYELQAARLKKKMDIYLRFKESLVEFVQEIGNYSLKREPSSIPELLGKVVLDCLDQEKEYNNLLSKIEEGAKNDRIKNDISEA